METALVWELLKPEGGSQWFERSGLGQSPDRMMVVGLILACVGLFSRVHEQTDQHVWGNLCVCVCVWTYPHSSHNAC